QTLPLSLDFAAGNLRLRLAGSAGAHSEPFWTIREEGGRTVWAAGQPEPTATLQAGRYLVELETQEKQYQRVVELRAGETRLIELGNDGAPPGEPPGRRRGYRGFAIRGLMLSGRMLGGGAAARGWLLAGLAILAGGALDAAPSAAQQSAPGWQVQTAPPQGRDGSALPGAGSLQVPPN